MTQQQQIQAATDYYRARLILQYRGLTRADETISILAKAGVADMILSQLGPAFDLATATGAQLDIIGKYVGVPRNIGPSTPVDYFGYALAAGGGSTNGYTSALGGVNLTGVYYRANSNQRQNTDLSDVQYRFVIQLKIVLNSTDNTMYSIQNYLAMFFAGLISVVDNHDMTMTYTVSPDVPLPLSVLEEYLPAPMGVGISIVSPTTSFDRVTTGGDLRFTTGGDTRITS